jgi:hypothetical protein
MPLSEHNLNLKEFINEKFTNLEKQTELTRASMEKRLEGMNEFRDALRDQTSKFITRTEHEAMMHNYDKDIRELRESRAVKQVRNQFMLLMVLPFYYSLLI